ncbi:MAG: hypothetical protein ABS81_09415 [Pseudonocardia sp. SCN 72-86]|nr:MAG: hypothetical protein ABS81_09415 [Pseudonocardia sp. SCN 72-86]
MVRCSTVGRPVRYSPTTAAVVPPARIWPSSPTLSRPARDATTQPIAASTSGTNLVSVAPNCAGLPNTPSHIAAAALPMGAPVSAMTSSEAASASTTARTLTAAPRSAWRFTCSPRPGHR